MAGQAYSQRNADVLLSQSKQEAAEVTLETQVKAGASGYSITGGGDQGIFIKQVLKESSAAKLFSLQAGATMGPAGGGSAGAYGMCETGPVLPAF